MPKYFLFMQQHDWEGTFGGWESYDTQDEALEAALKFQEHISGVQGGEWTIIEGTELLTGFVSERNFR
jgi:hypothetical protein